MRAGMVYTHLFEPFDANAFCSKIPIGLALKGKRGSFEFLGLKKHVAKTVLLMMKMLRNLRENNKNKASSAA